MEITPITDPGSPSKERQQVVSELKKKTRGKRTIEDGKYAKGAGTERNYSQPSLSMPMLFQSNENQFLIIDKKFLYFTLSCQ